MTTTGTRTGREAGHPIAANPIFTSCWLKMMPPTGDLILRELSKGEFEITSEVVQTAEEFRQRIKTRCPTWCCLTTTWGNGEEPKLWRFCAKKGWTFR